MLGTGTSTVVPGILTRYASAQMTVILCHSTVRVLTYNFLALSLQKNLTVIYSSLLRSTAFVEGNLIYGDISLRLPLQRLDQSGRV
jgi:hypothetical protein